MTRPTRQGFSLLELLVTMSLLAIIASAAVMAIRQITPADPESVETMLADSLRETLRSGRRSTIAITVDGRPVAATANADGSVVADSALHVDRLTGRPSHAP